MKSKDDGIKQRLVGAVVLLALAVIFLPVLFDRNRLEPLDTATQIPPKPDIVPITVPEPMIPEVESPAPDPETMFVPDEAEAVDATPEPPTLKPTGEPQSWVLQVASFRVDKHATTLRDKLNSAGHAAYTRNSNFKNGTVTRVFVGPKLSKSALIEEKALIDKEFHVDSLVLEFKP